MLQNPRHTVGSPPEMESDMADLVSTLIQPDQELLEDRWLTGSAGVNLLRVDMPSACLEGCRIPCSVAEQALATRGFHTLSQRHKKEGTDRGSECLPSVCDALGEHPVLSVSLPL